MNNSRRLNHPASITQFNLVCSSENRVTGQPHVCLTSTYYFKVSFTTAFWFTLAFWFVKVVLNPSCSLQKMHLHQNQFSPSIFFCTLIFLLDLAGCYNPLYSRVKQPCCPSTLYLLSYLFQPCLLLVYTKHSKLPEEDLLSEFFNARFQLKLEVQHMIIQLCVIDRFICK